MQSLVLGIPTYVLDLVQEGLVERKLHDGLFPELKYRQLAALEEWEAGQGTEIFVTRRGLMTPTTRPLAPRTDPIPKVGAYEQWIASLARYGDSIDVDLPQNSVLAIDDFQASMQMLGMQAGQSLNRIARNALFGAYLGGHTTLVAATVAASDQIEVSSLNGFVTTIPVAAGGIRPVAVSAATPLQITIDYGVTDIVRNVVGAIPHDANNPFGPGILKLDANVGAIVAARAAVVAVDRPTIIRAGGGTSVDAIAANDYVTLQDFVQATMRLRARSVPPFEDGTYHAHVNPSAITQMLADPDFLKLHTGAPDHERYGKGVIGTIAGITFIDNNESPTNTNAGDLTGTGNSAYFSEGIGAETVNEQGVGIGRVVVLGKGALIEKRFNEVQNFKSEAGITGKETTFQVVNAGVKIETEGVRLILRSPLNRLQDIIAATWSATTSFPVPSDITASGPERYKRAITIEHASSF